MNDIRSMRQMKTCLNCQWERKRSQFVGCARVCERDRVRHGNEIKMRMARQHRRSYFVYPTLAKMKCAMRREWKRFTTNRFCYVLNVYKPTEHVHESKLISNWNWRTNVLISFVVFSRFCLSNGEIEWELNKSKHKNGLLQMKYKRKSCETKLFDVMQLETHWNNKRRREIRTVNKRKRERRAATKVMWRWCEIMMHMR